MFMLVAGLLVTALTIVAIIRSRREGLDEIYEGVTPGQLPRAGEEADTRRVPETAYSKDVAVQFTPPGGLRPGLVGTVYDGVAESRDVTATIVDLAVRGYVKITAVEPEEDAGEARGPSRKPLGRKKADWEVTAQDPPADDELSVMEAHLLNGMFAYGPSVRISQLTSDFGSVMREAVQALYTEAVHRGWYRRHPRTKRGLSGFGLWGLAGGAAIVMLVAGGWAGAVAGVLTLGSAAAWQKLGRVLPGRTATGTAVRIQALAFEEYLRTAEADQIKFEEAADIFSRYLPYAIVFGVADHWAKVFGEIASQAKLEGYDDLDFGLDWIDMVILADLLDLPQLAFLAGEGLTELIGGLDVSGVADVVSGGLGAFSDGVGSFVDSVDGLDTLGDGCDGCDLDF
ncbi:Predicted membrane protein [Raineyella antarctica]|uniref:Predicted membrane protein n=2 Tax=Raineyella antarctica TaxID=1577474 RepID=A0A1G6HRH8_9ACTN|nr:Predicted membrane protein [Raineyella antarctica]